MSTLLQKVVFSGIEKDKQALYYRTVGDAEISASSIIMKVGSNLSFNTYFGVFSPAKWNKYTIVENVFLRVCVKGVFSLKVYRLLKDGEREKIAETTASGETDLSIPNIADGLIYFDLTAQTDSEFSMAGFYCEQNGINEVKIATAICTYKREKFVKRNLKELSEKIFSDRGSPLFDKLDVYVVDNAKTLSDIEREHVKIIPNLNAGGAGGFTRGMIEIMQAGEYSHILLMDDDVEFDVESLLRSYAFLSLLKKEYLDVWISGSMLRLDAPTIQSEKANYYDVKRGIVVPLSAKLDLTEERNLLKNEGEEEINYSSWWYCIMPSNVIRKDNLPLPLFIKRDDIEYGLRNGKRFATINGVCVWHEPFENKRPASFEYYYTRNGLIMDFFSKKPNSFKEYRKRILTGTLLSILRFRYEEAFSLLCGVDDFCNGIDWLKTTSPEEINKIVSDFNYKNTTIDVNLIEKVKEHSAKTPKYVRLLTANGWILPSRKVIKVPAYRPSYKLFFRAKTAINGEADNGFITKRSYKLALKCMGAYFKTMKKFKRRFPCLIKEYEEKGAEIATLDFWTEYLKLNSL